MASCQTHGKLYHKTDIDPVSLKLKRLSLVTCCHRFSLTFVLRVSLCIKTRSLDGMVEWVRLLDFNTRFKVQILCPTTNRAKVSVSLVDFVRHSPDGHVKFLGEIVEEVQITEVL